MKKKTNQSTKVLVCNVIVIVLIALAFSVSLVLDRKNDQVNYESTQKGNTQMIIEQYFDASDLFMDMVRHYVATGDESYKNEYEQSANVSKTAVTLFEQAKEKCAVYEDAIPALNELNSLLLERMELEEEVITAMKNGDKEKASEIVYSDEYDQYLTDFDDKYYEVIERIEESSNVRMTEAKKTESVWTGIQDASFVVIIIAIIILMYIVNKELIYPIKRIKVVVDTLSEGNLDAHTLLKEDTSEVGQIVVGIHKLIHFQKTIIEDIDYLLSEMADGNFAITTRAKDCYKGDYGSIIESIRKINRKLDGVIREISQASDQVASGAGQVANASQALSQGATEQAGSIQELSATISDINTNVQKNTASAEKLNTVALDMLNDMNLSDEKMKTMVKAMKEISTISSEINKIVNTIDDIAFQTNILALNAAVEAARAGDAGRGFSVVAEEVRSLAAKSADAAKNTTDLIQRVMIAVDNGSECADATAAAMNVVMGRIDTAAAGVAEITRNSEEQSTSINQTTIGVDQISTVVQSNSATAEESAAASEELSAQAQMLKDLMSQFILRSEKYYEMMNEQTEKAMLDTYTDLESDLDSENTADTESQYTSDNVDDKY